MKTKKRFLTRWAPVLMFALFGALVFSSCDKSNDSTTNNTPYTISGDASGSQVVPAVSGTGTATITGTYDPTTRMMKYTTNWSNLTGVPTSGGFYTGAAGTAGTALGAPWEFDSTMTGTGNMSDSITLTTDQATQLTKGNIYYLLGTAANTGGEVRGQITATR